MTYFHSPILLRDYGTKIQMKCYEPITRINQTVNGEKCVNWEIIDSFGLRMGKSESKSESKIREQNQRANSNGIFYDNLKTDIIDDTFISNSIGPELTRRIPSGPFN